MPAVGPPPPAGPLPIAALGLPPPGPELPIAAVGPPPPAPELPIPAVDAPTPADVLPVAAPEPLMLPDAALEIPPPRSPPAALPLAAIATPDKLRPAITGAIINTDFNMGISFPWPNVDRHRCAPFVLLTWIAEKISRDAL